MKHSQNQVVKGLGLEFAPQDGRIAVIENSVLATTRRVLGSNAHEQLKLQLRKARQQRLEQNSMKTYDKITILSPQEIRYYQDRSKELRAQEIAKIGRGFTRRLKNFVSNLSVPQIEVVSDWPSTEQIRSDIARGEKLRAETFVAAFANIGQYIGNFFKSVTANLKLGHNSSNESALLQDRELRRHIKHAEQLRAAFMADAVVAMFSSIAQVFAGVFKKLGQWHRQRVTWRELNSLSDYLLHDIGLNRDQLKHMSKDILSRKGTWIDQVARNLQVTPTSTVVSVDVAQTPEHAANDGHRELAA